MSQIDRTTTGIPGLDRLTRGGLPDGATISIIGSYGTGKTVTGIHFMHDGVTNKETCLYLTLDQPPSQLRFDAAQIGKDLSSGDTVDIHHIQDEDTTAMIDSAVEIIENSQADRIVVDTISVMLSDTSMTETDRRQQLERLRSAVAETEATALLLAEAHPQNAHQSRNGIVEHMTDGVIILDYTAVSEKTFRTLEVRKLRNTSYRPGAHPMTIDGTGIQVDTKTTI